MSDAGKADLLAEELRNLDSDPYIDTFILRLATAEDPEAEAEAIIQEARVMADCFIRTLKPVMDMYNRWRDGGLTEAEFHANRSSDE